MVKKNVLLIGGRSKAKSMAISLLEQGDRVTVINSNYDDCVMLAEIQGLTVIHGDGTKPYILDEAGAARCDIVIALTGKDTDNLVACQLCKKQFRVLKTVSLVVDPNKTEFFTQMGVDNVVCAISAVTAIIQQQVFIDEVPTIIPVGKGQVQIVEVQISSESPVAGKKLCEVTLPNEVTVGCVLRSDSILNPCGETSLLVGDILVVITCNGQEMDTIHALTGRGYL